MAVSVAGSGVSVHDLETGSKSHGFSLESTQTLALPCTWCASTRTFFSHVGKVGRPAAARPFPPPLAPPSSPRPAPLCSAHRASSAGTCQRRTCRTPASARYVFPLCCAHDCVRFPTSPPLALPHSTPPPPFHCHFKAPADLRGIVCHRFLSHPVAVSGGGTLQTLAASGAGRLKVADTAAPPVDLPVSGTHDCGVVAMGCCGRQRICTVLSVRLPAGGTDLAFDLLLFLPLPP